MNWHVYAASAIGKGHIDGGTRCQDAFTYVRGNGRLVAVVCDGAGSASQSEIGAQEFAKSVSSYLAELVGGSALACERSAIERAVECARTVIECRAAELNLPTRELACTLVGAVLHDQGGCLFHIGDGIGVADIKDGSEVFSLPENGEYTNETYFVTIDDWKEHLRVEQFSGKVQGLVLMSDGTMSFAVKRSRLHGPFIDPVKSYLATVGELEGSEALQATLGGEGTWSITNDDKTLIVVLPH